MAAYDCIWLHMAGKAPMGAMWDGRCSSICLRMAAVGATGGTVGAAGGHGGAAGGDVGADV